MAPEPNQRFLMDRIPFRQKMFWIPAGIVLVSFFLRLSLISRGPYSGDCLYLTMAAQETLATGRLQHLPIFGYPLAVLLAAAFIQAGSLVFGADAVMSVNMMGVVFSSLSVLAFYILASMILDSRTALYSSVMFSVAPIFMGLSVYGKDQVVCLFFLLLGLALYVQFLREGGKPAFYLSAASFGLMGAARFQDLALMIIPLSWLFFVRGPLFHQNHWNRIKIFFFFWLIVLNVAGIFHVIYIFQEVTREGYFKQLISWWRLVGFGDYQLGVFSPMLGAAFRHIVGNLTVPGVVLAVWGAGLVFFRDKKFLVFLLSWILVPLLYYGNNRGMVTARYLLIVVPPLVLLEGVALTWLFQRRRGGPWAARGLWILLIALAWGRVYPNLKFRHDHALLPEYVRWVSRVTEPEARIIVADEARFFLYYGERSVIGRPADVIKTGPTQLWEFKEQLDSLLAQQVPVYITTASLYAYDRDRHFSDFIKKHYDLMLVGQQLYEDWHRGEMEWQVFPCALFRLQRKSS